MNIYSWVEAVNRWIGRTRPIDTDDISWHTNSLGWHAILKRPPEEINVNQSGVSASDVGPYPALVKSKGSGYYVCDIYENGTGEDPTLLNQEVRVLMLNLAETIPSSTWIMVSLSSIGQTGGGNVST